MVGSMSTTIGELASRTGVPAHVLRHWDAVGVLAARRTEAGHRRYGDDAVERVALIRLLQRVGFRLADISALASAGQIDRAPVVERHAARLKEQRRELQGAISFLEHTLSCEHPVITQCARCRRFARSFPPR